MSDEGKTVPRVVVYTDGACEGNPGPGGWAYKMTYGDHVKTDSGGEPHTTNNRMELMAALQALRGLKRDCQVTVYTDSTYLKKGVTEWLAGWKARGWKRKEGELANVDLWQALDRELQKHQVVWKWLRGHAGHPENTQVDSLARQAARQAGSSPAKYG